MNKKLLALPLASLAIGSLLALGGPQTASASATDTCDKSFMTLTKTDANTGAPLEGAVYTATTTGDVYLIPGDAQAQEVAFKAAFNDYLENQIAGAPFESTTIGSAITAAGQEALGTDPVDLPSDVSDTENRDAWDAWLADSDGTVAALRADVQRRFDAVDAANNAYFNSFVGIDPAFDNHNASLRNRLYSMLTAIDTAQNATSYSTFASNVHYLTNPDNWDYGYSVTPSTELQDAIVFADGGKTRAEAFSEANAYAAGVVGAVQTADITTDANGIGNFTLVSVNNAYYDAGTRGDLSCSQLTATLQETTAPTGYQLNPATYTASSLANETGSVAAVDLPVGAPTPPPPTRASTGL